MYVTVIGALVLGPRGGTSILGGMGLRTPRISVMSQSQGIRRILRPNPRICMWFHMCFHYITIENCCLSLILQKVTEHKHLGIILDPKLSFSAHIKSAISKTRRGIGLLKYLSKYLPRHTLNELYKLYVRPHLDYGDVIYHKVMLPIISILLSI